MPQGENSNQKNVSSPGTGGAVGSVMRTGDELVVSFAFTPRRYRAIRSITGARYHPTSKTWRLPLQSVNKLSDSRELGPHKLFYDFDEKSLHREVEERDSRLSEARSVIRANPFSVPLSVITVARPEVVFTFESRKEGIVAQGAKKMLEPFLGKERWSRGEKGFLVSVEELPPLLLRLRDAGVLFAVEAELGEALKASHPFRREALEKIAKGISVSAEILKKGLFSPILTADDISLKLLNCSGEILRLLMPHIKSVTARREKGERLMPLAALQLMYEGMRAKQKVWLSSEALAHFYSTSAPELEEGFDDAWALHPAVTNVIAEIPGEGLVEITGVDTGAPFSLFGESNRWINRKDPEGVKSRGVLIAERTKVVALLERRERDALREKKDVRGILKNQAFEEKLFPHQRVAVEWLLRSPCGLLGDDMGLGKTISVLAAFEELHHQDSDRFLLVVAPASLVLNWKREWERWLPGHHHETLPGVRERRIRFLDDVLRCEASHLQGLVVSLEELRLEYVYPRLRELLALKKAVLCIDESQRVKNHQSKGFHALSVLAPLCDKRWALSGTPVPRSIADIWAQMKLLDGGARLGKSYLQWLKSVAELGTEWSAVGIKKFIPEQVEKTIAIISPLILRRRKEEVVDLPPKIFHVRDLELSGDQKRRYDEVRKDLVLRLQSIHGEEFYREITSILEQYLRAVQIASNPRLVDPAFSGDPAKFLELDELVDEIVGERREKLVIWTNYLGNVRELKERYRGFNTAAFSGETAPKDRQGIIEAFQGDSDAAPRILVAVPAAGGVGITLTKAQTAVYVDKTWNAEHWLQSIDRLHRIGQTGTVNIISLQASKVDALVAKNLARKEDMLRNVMDGAPVSIASGLTREELMAALVEGVSPSIAL